LLYRGELTPDDAVSDLVVLLMREGADFHTAVEASMPTAEVSDERQLLSVLQMGISVFQPPLLDNKALRIYGRPDGIEPSAGQLVPIEIKSHQEVKLLDELELAFYWLLLEPYRTSRLDPPRGVLLLRQEGEPVRVEVELTPRRFGQVERYVEAVRRARKWPVTPRVCGCHVCRGARRQEVLASAAAEKDCSMLFGVGWAYGDVLKEIGINSYDELVTSDATSVALAFKVRGYLAVGRSTVRRWQIHAQSYRSGAAIYFGDEFPIGKEYCALDLEYLNGPWGAQVFLAGVAIVQSETQCRLLWAAQGADEERQLLVKLSDLLHDHADLPVVTWAGLSADLPEMRKAEARHNIPPVLDGLDHCDLYQYAQRSLRLPTPWLGIKELVSYLGMGYDSDVQGGFHAQNLYLEWVDCHEPTRRDEIRKRLEDYNRADLIALIGVAEQLRKIAELGQRADAHAGGVWE
jgi:predicted RecB family nuclease